ncbi:MAG: DUF4255 domain-containing protein [Pseudomonadales bacterium]|jgi:hypothetical protein
MINSALNQLAYELNESLQRTFSLDENIVVVSNTVEQDGSLPLQANNKVALSLINIERETFTQKGGGYGGSSFSRSVVGHEPIYLNLYVMVSICFGGNNYLESMKFLSTAIAFFQRRPVFDHSNTPDLDDQIDKLALDIENLSIQDLSNVWGVLGGKYFPSVLYRVRMVAIDPGDIRDQAVSISSTPESAVRG